MKQRHRFSSRMSPIWSVVNFSLWGFHGGHGVTRKVKQRLNRQSRAVAREARLPLRQRLAKGIAQTFRFRPVKWGVSR